jgi:YHS domain-containing protein
MKNYVNLFLLAVLALFVGGCSSYQIIQPPKQNVGLVTVSSLNEKQIVISQDTPVLKYNNRLYYFADDSELKLFKEMPEVYIMKYNFNETPVAAKPLESDYRLRTYCSYNGDPIVISEFTPAATYMGRIYYFAHPQARSLFIEDPQCYVAKFPANQAPKIISPLKSEYGTKTVCGTTGTTLLVGPHTPTLEYIGRAFYFRDIIAMEEFQKDPQSMITKPFNNEELKIKN